MLTVPLLLLPWDCCRVKRNAGGASDRVLTDLELQRGNFVSKISVFFHNNVSTSLCCGDKTAQQLQVVFFRSYYRHGFEFLPNLKNTGTYIFLKLCKNNGTRRKFLAKIVCF